VGIKMLLVDIYKIPISMALGTVAAVLLISVIASMVYPPKTTSTPSAVDPPGTTPKTGAHPTKDH
jgi:hypothetical protein